MLRRDYILRMVDEFLEVLARIRGLKREQHWREAALATDDEFRKLVGSGADALLALSDTELLAKLIQSEPTQVTRDKTLMLATLLKERGDLAAGEGRDSVPYHLKALHLLLEVLARDEPDDCPEFVPRVDELVGALGTTAVPLATQARLMQHFERTGQFGKAEDRLYEMLEQEPDQAGLVEFGLAFYDRVAQHSDAALAEGNLPRAELEAGKGELWQRRAATTV
ncbi:MAG TPA: DUF6483 family protein [Verrucomicrobiae bacterium]|nr:DUF6483 family protein [Verrucomicrobiae bacterium]